MIVIHCLCQEVLVIVHKLKEIVENNKAQVSIMSIFKEGVPVGLDQCDGATCRVHAREK